MQALPKSILNENTEYYIKREEEIIKMKKSIVGFQGIINQDVGQHIIKHEYDNLETNLTGNMRPSISPRYTNSPSKDFSP